MRTRAEGVAFWLMLLVGSVASVLCLITTLTTGIGWDSGIDTQAAIEVGRLDGDWDLRTAYEAVYSTSEFYGVLVQWMAEGLHHLTGGTGPLDPGSLATYRWQGVVSVSLLIGSAAVAGIAVGAATRSRLAGAFSWATVMTIPLVNGLGAIDFKDAPVASGLLLISSGITLATVVRRRSTGWVLAPVVIALGAFITLGVRIGSWPLVFALMGLSGFIVAGFLARRREWSTAVRVAGASMIGLAIAILGVYLLNPFARLDLVRWMYDAYLTAQSFPWSGTVRTFGQDLDATGLPLWYAPGWFLAQVPIAVSVVFGAGAILWIILVIRSWRSPADGPMFAMAPFVIQSLVLPAAIVASGAVLYDGIRHLMFAVAAVGPVSAVTIAWVQQWPWLHRQRWGGWGLIVLAGVPAASLVADLRWFPYQYAHVNVVAGQVQGSRPWELDYWGVTALEGVTRLREAGLQEVVVLPELDPRGTAQVVGPLLAPEDLARAQGPVGVYVFRRWDASLPEGCERLFTIERAGQLLGEAGSCPPGITGGGESRSGQ